MTSYGSSIITYYPQGSELSDVQRLWTFTADKASYVVAKLHLSRTWHYRATHSADAYAAMADCASIKFNSGDMFVLKNQVYSYVIRLDSGQTIQKATKQPYIDHQLTNNIL